MARLTRANVAQAVRRAGRDITALHASRPFPPPPGHASGSLRRRALARARLLATVCATPRQPMPSPLPRATGSPPHARLLPLLNLYHGHARQLRPAQLPPALPHRYHRYRQRLRYHPSLWQSPPRRHCRAGLMWPHVLPQWPLWPHPLRAIVLQPGSRRPASRMATPRR